MERLKRVFRRGSVCSSPSCSISSSSCHSYSSDLFSSLDRSQFICRPSLPSSSTTSSMIFPRMEAGIFPRPEASIGVHPVNGFDDSASDISEFLILTELMPKYKKKSKRSTDGHSTTASRRSNASSLVRKRLSIVEPDASSFVFFDADEYSRAPPLPKTMLRRVPSRSILKKQNPANIYEEIVDDCVTPLPDVRPQLPARPEVHSLRLFPPCTLFQPRAHLSENHSKYPEQLKRKKLPSLHHRRANLRLIEF
ncbi:unnamed protein product, partial [Mesorhabditis belari]|uniref:Uncharacterized protein n=1 Tax=Mesorhabditis belari TaxID=2138241 RepID=A0AAF3FHQ5_9BILA